MKKRLLLILLLLLSAMLLCLAACVKENLPDINPPDVDPPDVDPPVVEYAHIGGSSIPVDSDKIFISPDSRTGYLQHLLTDDDIPELSKLTKLVSLHIDYAEITNLDFLAFMPDLVYFWVRGCPNLTDIDGVMYLENVSYLYLQFLPIVDLPPLNQDSLKYLELIGCYGLKDFDFEKLSSCKNLIGIGVDGIHVNLEKIISLIEQLSSDFFNLSIQCCNIRDLSPLLRVAEKITYLDIARNGMENDELEYLEAFVNLEVLRFGFNFFTDLAPVIRLAQLGTLHTAESFANYYELYYFREGLPYNFGENDFLGGLPFPEEQWDELYAIVRENDLRYREENG